VTVEVLGEDSGISSSSVPSVRSSVVDKERMRPGHLLTLVLCVLQCLSTLTVGWQEGHRTSGL